MPATTHLLEVSDPATGASRMFTGDDPDQVRTDADAWLDSALLGAFDHAQVTDFCDCP